MITIIADESKGGVGTELLEELLSNGVQADYISLDGVEVKPCVSCGGCTYKTYGKCVTRDDGDWIYPKIIRSDVLIIVSPIVFGGYSFKIKRVLDKLGLIMDRHYFIENGEMVKGGLAGRQFKFFAVGVGESCGDDERVSFKKLHHETVVISRGAGKAYIVEGVFNGEIKNQILAEVLGA